MANQEFVGVPSQVDARTLSRGATDFQRLRRGLLINYIVLGAGAILDGRPLYLDGQHIL